MSGIWAVLPVKTLDNAKTRLSPVLTPLQRRELFAAMVEDVLAVLTAAAGLGGVIVVSEDAQAAGLARRYGAELTHEGGDHGQSSAVAFAARMVKARGGHTILTVPGDVPCLHVDDIAEVVRAASPAPSLAIVPSHDGQGSNALLASPPDLIPFSFGHHSLRPHLDAAALAGVRSTLLDLPGLALDVDTPQDLALAIASGRMGPGTGRWIAASGLAGKLEQQDAAGESTG